MKPRTTGALAVLAVAAALALFFLFSRAAAVELTYPVERARMALSRKVISRISGMFRAAEVNAENIRLRREVASLAMVALELERLEIENARLRSVLAYKERTAQTWLAACVLSEDGGAAGRRRTVRVDKGSLDGVARDSVVVVPDGLVGRVDHVTPHTAEVVLVSDAGTKVACDIEAGGSLRIRGMLMGGGDDMLELRFFDDVKADAPPRSRVVTSGCGGLFPGGIEIGSYLGSGKVVPSVDFSTLEDVFIRCAK